MIRDSFDNDSLDDSEREDYQEQKALAATRWLLDEMDRELEQEIDAAFLRIRQGKGRRRNYERGSR